MNRRINRKQIVIVGLALFLAMVSYLIPLPQRPGSQSKSEMYTPVEQDMPSRPSVIAGETAITWQFPQDIKMPQTMAQFTLDGVAESPLDRSRIVEGMIAQDNKLANGKKPQSAMSSRTLFGNGHKLPR